MSRDHWNQAKSFRDFLAHAEAHPELWRGIYERAEVPREFVERAAALPGRWHLLVLSEDWCGDAVNTVPVVAKLAEAAPNLDMRLLARDENLELMDAHLTGTSRSIPVVIVLDARFRERGWWGPRPAELQEWFLGEGRALEQKERYREIRRWYAHDHGRTTLEEVVSLLERAAAEEPGRVCA